MKEAIRCCISCILPCGSLDVIRIVHSDGRVEEIGGGRAICAAEIMEAHPKHVLRKLHSPASIDHDYSSSAATAPPRAVTLPPTAELKRGKIYFLMQVSSSTAAARDCMVLPQMPRRPRRWRREREEISDGTRLLVSSDRNVSGQVLLEKVSAQRERRRGRAGVWRPHLESISELPFTDL